jgi:hypothetical protein
LSPSETFPFRVEVLGNSAHDAAITVLDGHDEVRGTGRGTVDLDLPAGLYAIRVERAGMLEENVRRHAGPTSLQVEEPKRFSAVPANDTATSHEYYQAPAIHWSQQGQSTAPPLSDGAPQGSLFLFVRAPSAEATRAPLEQLYLSILDYSGRPLAVLDKTSTARDDQAGWLAYHAAAMAGEYVLHYEPPTGVDAAAREMALAVFAGWQTQIFVTLTDGLAFASTSVLMGDGFRPDDRVAQAVDAALTGLQNRTDLLQPDQRQLLLDGKFENPMLGLVGAHLLFQASTIPEDTLDTVLGNLEWLLGPGSPDLRALELMAARSFGRPVRAEAFERPPMLRLGLEAVIEAAVETPALVPSGGLLSQIALGRFVDSPWTTWKPLVGAADAMTLASRAEAASWVSSYVEEAALQAARKGAEPDLAAIASRAVLPLASVSDAYDELRRTSPPGSRRTVEMERLVAQTRRDARKLAVGQDEARNLFFDGGDGDRIRALALMQGDPSIRDFDVALDGIADSRSAFEQYHALRLAQLMVPTLDDQQRGQLATAIERQRQEGGWITPGSDRRYLSERVLTALD